MIHFLEPNLWVVPGLALGSLGMPIRHKMLSQSLIALGFLLNCQRRQISSTQLDKTTKFSPPWQRLYAKQVGTFLSQASPWDCWKKSTISVCQTAFWHFLLASVQLPNLQSSWLGSMKDPFPTQEWLQLVQCCQEIQKSKSEPEIECILLHTFPACGNKLV